MCRASDSSRTPIRRGAPRFDYALFADAHFVYCRFTNDHFAYTISQGLVSPTPCVCVRVSSCVCDFPYSVYFELQCDLGERSLINRQNAPSDTLTLAEGKNSRDQRSRRNERRQIVWHQSGVQANLVSFQSQNVVLTRCWCAQPLCV